MKDHEATIGATVRYDNEFLTFAALPVKEMQLYMDDEAIIQDLAARVIRRRMVGTIVARTTLPGIVMLDWNETSYHENRHLCPVHIENLEAWRTCETCDTFDCEDRNAEGVCPD